MVKRFDARKLANGDCFVFDAEQKSVYLFSESNAKDWEHSDKTHAALTKLAKEGKANFFDKKMLSSIARALLDVAFLKLNA